MCYKTEDNMLRQACQHVCQEECFTLYFIKIEQYKKVYGAKLTVIQVLIFVQYFGLGHLQT